MPLKVLAVVGLKRKPRGRGVDGVVVDDGALRVPDLGDLGLGQWAIVDPDIPHAAVEIIVLAEADFLLNRNRLNVAISRPRKKLVVVASRSVTSLLVSDLEVFEQAMIWKRLYHRCAREPLWEGHVDGHLVRVRGAGA